MYGILIGGIFYLISCADINASFPEKYILNESGRWIMPLLEWSEISFLRESILEHYRKNPNQNPPQ
jgi:hypothetical protein